MRFALARGVVVLATNETVRPIAVVSEREVVDCRCRRAMPVEFGIDGFRAFDVTVGNLQRQISCGIPGKSAAIRIEIRLIEIVTVFVRFAAGEKAAFDLYIAPNQTCRGDAERDVR